MPVGMSHPLESLGAVLSTTSLGRRRNLCQPCCVHASSTCTVHDSSAVDGVHVLRLKLVCSQALKPGADTALDAAALEAIAEEAPSATLPRAKVVGATVVDVAVATGIQPSKGAARRLIKVLFDVKWSRSAYVSAAWCIRILGQLHAPLPMPCIGC